MVFSPNTFAGAPHAWLATLTEPDATAADDAHLLNAVTRAFPAVTTVRVKDALDIVNRLVGELATAIRAAASVALIASVLVLSGALAAGNRARVHDAVVLKTLGATRKTLIAAFTLEYMLIGLATAVFALAGGRRGVVVRGRPHHATCLRLPAAGRGLYAGHRAGADRRLRPDRHLARARPQGRAGAAQPLNNRANHATDAEIRSLEELQRPQSRRMHVGNCLAGLIARRTATDRGHAVIDQSLSAYLVRAFKLTALSFPIAGATALGTYRFVSTKDPGSAVATLPDGRMLTFFGLEIFGFPQFWIVVLSPLGSGPINLV